jgi:hypothetical protein
MVGAVAALLIASWFVHSYTQLVCVRLRLEIESPALPRACTMLRDYSLFTLLLPLLIIIAGVIMILAQMETGMTIVCQSGWLLAIALICFAIVAWEVPFIPLF